MKLNYMVRVTYSSPRHLGLQTVELSLAADDDRAEFIQRFKGIRDISPSSFTICWEEPVDLSPREALWQLREHIKVNEQK